MSHIALTGHHGLKRSISTRSARLRPEAVALDTDRPYSPRRKLAIMVGGSGALWCLIIAGVYQMVHIIR